MNNANDPAVMLPELGHSVSHDEGIALTWEWIEKNGVRALQLMGCSRLVLCSYIKVRFFRTIFSHGVLTICGVMFSGIYFQDMSHVFPTTSILRSMEPQQLNNADRLIGEKFPMIAAETLAGNPITLPRDLNDQVCVLTVAFKQAAQKKIDSWANYILEDSSFRKTCYYELPLIRRIWKPFQGWIDKGMKSGIPVMRHDNVVTYYGDIRPYKRHLQISDSTDAYIFVIDKQGRIRYASKGYASPEKLQELKTVVDGLTQLKGKH